MKEKQPREKKGFCFDYDPSLEAMVMTIFDKDKLFPFYLRDSEAGLYKILKTTTGKLQMVK